VCIAKVHELYELLGSHAIVKLIEFKGLRVQLAGHVLLVDGTRIP